MCQFVATAVYGMHTRHFRGVKLSQIDHQVMFCDLIFEDCCVPPAVPMLNDNILRVYFFVPRH